MARKVFPRGRRHFVWTGQSFIILLWSELLTYVVGTNKLINEPRLWTHYQLSEIFFVSSGSLSHSSSLAVALNYLWDGSTQLLPLTQRNSAAEASGSDSATAVSALGCHSIMEKRTQMAWGNLLSSPCISLFYGIKLFFSISLDLVQGLYKVPWNSIVSSINAGIQPLSRYINDFLHICRE